MNRIRVRRSNSSTHRGREQSLAVEVSGARLDPQFLKPLIISGWIIVLLYLPSGMLHAVVGNFVYARDILLGLHLAASVFWLARNQQLRWVAENSWVILITPILLIPAVLDLNLTPNGGTISMEALRTCKWSLCWLDWFCLGVFLRMNHDWGKWFQVVVLVTIGWLVIELLAGVYELSTGQYLFPTVWGQRTAFGVLVGNDQYLGSEHRIRGLQRDVFSFANLMAMSAVAGMACLTITRRVVVQVGAALWTIIFSILMFVSGGRSALFGALAAAIYTVSILLFRQRMRRFGRRYVLIWLLIGIALSLLGVGRFTDWISDNLLGGAHYGDPNSAYMRDTYWVQMLAAFRHSPIILVIGGPFASLLDHSIARMFHWADNQFLWNLYHLGIAGFLGVAFYFFRVLQVADEWSEPHIFDTLILFLLLVLGEGIARESLTFMGCVALFITCGYVIASDHVQRLGSKRRRHASARSRT